MYFHSTAEESRFHLDGPEVENGKALLIKDKLTPTFGTNSISKKPITANNADSTKEPNKPASLQPNGSIHHLPLSAVRLPKLPAKPPDGHQINSKPKRKRRRLDKTSRDRSSSVSRSRTTTPNYDVTLKGTSTPDMLSSEKLDYIKPVYCEAPQPPSRPSTSKSKRDDVINRSMQTESNV